MNRPGFKPVDAIAGEPIAHEFTYEIYARFRTGVCDYVGTSVAPNDVQALLLHADAMTKACKGDWLIFADSIVVEEYVAVQIESQKPRRKKWYVDHARHGFTLIELLLTIAIVAIVVGALLPAMASGRKSARAAVCASNMRQCGMAVQIYVDTYGKVPFTNDTSGFGTIDGPVDDLPRSLYTCPDFHALNPYLVFSQRAGRMLTYFGDLPAPDPALLGPVSRHYELVPREWIFVEYTNGAGPHSGKRSTLRMDLAHELTKANPLDRPPLEH